MATYSFKNFRATLSGPGGNFSVGSDAGASEEGVSVDMIEDKDTMSTGAGGAIMHSLNASDSGRITIRLLKTSTTNALLSQMYNFQKNNSGSWGQNQFRGADTARGDVVTGSELAFVRQSALGYAKVGNNNEWVLQGRVFELLGIGSAAA